MATGFVKWWRARFLAGYRPFSGKLLWRLSVFLAIDSIRLLLSIRSPLFLPLCFFFVIYTRQNIDVRRNRRCMDRSRYTIYGFVRSGSGYRRDILPELRAAWCVFLDDATAVWQKWIPRGVTSYLHFSYPLIYNLVLLKICLLTVIGFLLFEQFVELSNIFWRNWTINIFIIFLFSVSINYRTSHQPLLWVITDSETKFTARYTVWYYLILFGIYFINSSMMLYILFRQYVVILVVKCLCNGIYLWMLNISWNIVERAVTYL